jgi:VWFA-related protein
MGFKGEALRLSVSSLLLPAIAFCFAVSLWAQTAPPASRPTQSEAVRAPQMQMLTQSPSATLDAEGGLIKLDVVVTDKSGKPVTGLEPTDLTLLDNGQPSKILSFQAFDGASAMPDPPVEVILVIDTLRMPGSASRTREEVQRFLRQNGGHLAQPLSIFSLLDSGLWLVAQPSMDGNALAEAIAHDTQLRSIRKAVGPSGLFGGGPQPDPPGLLALKALGDIATAERQKPGRKLLVWVGPSREDNGAPFEPQRLFSMITWFSTLLREARVALYSFSVGESYNDPRSIRYKGFLNGVKSARQAEFDDLNRKVLAVQSGGRVLGPGNDLVSEIGNCVEEASSFYTLSFDPAHAHHPNDYHDLRVQVGPSGLTARSVTGYYDQPYYQDQPNLLAKRVTVEQLEQVLGAARGKSDGEVARRLSNLELTEQLSDTKLSSWTAGLRGAKAREALVALADASAFLAPPAVEVPAGAPPDPNAQQSMISLAVDYLNEAIPKLPNFFATRTTVRYVETPPYDEGSARAEYQALHLADSSKATVLYRHGQEVVDSAAATRTKQKEDERHLTTYGTFGPILSAAIDAAAAREGFAWSRWEQGAGGPRAVFRYAIPEERSHFQVAYCCLPEGDGTISFEKRQGYHGEIAIDPTSGAILRLTMEADLNPALPLVRSDILVKYGPVEIGGKTYICPVRSVSVWRSRTVSVLALADWDESFRTYGPFATMLNDVAFDSYHLFRAESRVLTGDPAPEKK